MTSVFAAALAFSLAAPQPVTLGRTFAPNEQFTYRVASKLQIQSRESGLQTFIPEDLQLRYDFNYRVTSMKTDGIAVVRYLRPTVTQIDGETFERGPLTTVERTNDDLTLTMSPFNRVLGMKNNRPAKWLRASSALRQEEGLVGQFISEVYRLSLFTGSFDSSLDFAPPLPLTPVVPGDTWKNTVSYQPQKLTSKGGKSAVQRLDFTYTYRGVVPVGNAKVHRIEGVLNLDSDLAAYLKENFDLGEAGDELTKFQLKLTSKVIFDLDLKTRRTLRASATSTGGFQLFTSEDPNQAAIEEKLSGTTTLFPVTPSGTRRSTTS